MVLKLRYPLLCAKMTVCQPIQITDRGLCFSNKQYGSFSLCSLVGKCHSAASLQATSRSSMLLHHAL